MSHIELTTKTPCPDCGNPLTFEINGGKSAYTCKACGFTDSGTKNDPVNALPHHVACPNCGSTSTLWFNNGDGTINCSKCGYISRARKENDNINSPSHYVGKIECIDYLRDKLTKEEFTGFCMGNVLKYSSRWRKKDGLQDLKKAKVYLDWAIENEEKE